MFGFSDIIDQAFVIKMLIVEPLSKRIVLWSHTIVEYQHQENENSGDTGQRVSWDSFPSHMQIATCHSEKMTTCEQRKRASWVCGGDHLVFVRPHRDKIPRDKWYKNTMESHHTFLKSAYVNYVRG